MKRLWFWLILFSLGARVRAAENPAGDDDLFSRIHVWRIAIEISPDGIQTLRQSQPKQNGRGKPRTVARITEGGRVYTNVTAQLKGYSSFQPIDSTPSFTLNFESRSPKQKFHGLSKISLNNSAQDITRLNEVFTRPMFAAADVPVPRANYAWVTLNGQELGLYVLLEGYDKKFLARHFKRTDGNLYDGGLLQDIDRPMIVTSGKNPNDHSGVRRLVNATREPDPDKRFRLIEAALDMDCFLSMTAMETLLCHSDSYSMNRNNFRLYQNPSTGKMVFMPHGADRVMGTHRSGLDLTIVPPMLGMVARATLSTPEGRRRYLDRVGTLFTNFFQPTQLCQRLHQTEATLTKELGSRANTGFRLNDGYSQMISQGVEDMCARIRTRYVNLQMQFSHLSEVAVPAPLPKFGSDGIATVTGWKPKWRDRQPDVTCEEQSKDGKTLLHVQSPPGVAIASIHSISSYLPGNYRLAGQIKVIPANPEGPVPSINTIVRRYSAVRFTPESQRGESSNLRVDFQVPDTRSPEEIDVICEIRNPPHEFWVDATSLRLMRQ